MTVVTPTDRPKSVRNRWVIEVFGGHFCCLLVFEFSVGIGFLSLECLRSSFFSKFSLCAKRSSFPVWDLSYFSNILQSCPDANFGLSIKVVGYLGRIQICMYHRWWNDPYKKSCQGSQGLRRERSEQGSGYSYHRNLRQIYSIWGSIL